MAGIVFPATLTQHKDLHRGGAQQILVDSSEGVKKVLIGIEVQWSASSPITLARNPLSVDGSSSVHPVFHCRDEEVELHLRSQSGGNLTLHLCSFHSHPGCD